MPDLVSRLTAGRHRRGPRSSIHGGGAALLAAAMLAGCERGPPASSGAIFADVTAESGVEFRLENGMSEARHLPETIIGGLGWIDHDGDGDLDLYLVNGHSDSRNAARPGAETNRLYRNDGNWRFTDVTAESGTGDRRYGCGVAVGDYDNDGRSDMLVTNFGRNTLYHNLGGGVFEDVTERAGLTEEGFSSSAVWFDMDRDGDLDLYVVNYVSYDPGTAKRCVEDGLTIYCHPKWFNGEPDLLYRNLGDGRFEEIGARAGIARGGPTEGKGLGAVTLDHDGDGLVDVYVANDLTPNFLWRNVGDGTFVDVGQVAGVALSADGFFQAGMGVDVADVNADGRLDIHVTNFSRELNALYLGEGGGAFRDRSEQCGLGPSFLSLGFGTLFIDVDLDGDEDIVVANGHVDDRVEVSQPGTGLAWKQRPQLFLNDGTGAFTLASIERAGAFFAERVVARGLAGCDVDRDGDVDLAMMTSDRSVVLLRNDNPDGNRSVTLRLVGAASPRDGFDARVEATVGSRTRVFSCQAGRSYASACDPAVVVGIGRAAALDRAIIRWSSGAVSDLMAVPAGSVRTVREVDSDDK